MNANDLKTKIVELKQILSNLHSIFDISKYQIEYDKIKDTIYDTKKKLDSNEYASAYKRLEEIKKTLEKEYLPFYKVHLLSSYINSKILKMNENNYDDVEKKVQELINGVDSILKSNDNLDNHKEKILHDAYLAIYHSLINEAMIEKGTILHICNQAKIHETIKFGIGQILKEELNKFPEEEVVDVAIDHVDEGFGYNFFSIDTIKKVGFSLLGEKNEEYALRKKSAIELALDERDKIIQEKKDLVLKKRRNVIKKRKLLSKIAKVRLKMISIFVLCPILGAFIGGIIGTTAKQHKQSTKVYNKVTNEIVSEEEEYVYSKYVYKANIKKYTPWYENPNGLGYFRNVEEWEYLDENQTDGISIDEILKAVERKDMYSEFKDILYEDDNTTEDTIYVTETIVDNNDYKTDESLFLLSVIFFGILGATAPLVYVADIGNYYRIDKNRIKEALEELEKTIKWKTIKESYVQIGEKTVKLQEEYDSIVNKYDAKEFDEDVGKEVKKYLRR